MIEKAESFKLRSSPQYYDSCSIYFKPNKNSILKIFGNIRIAITNQERHEKNNHWFYSSILYQRN